MNFRCYDPIFTDSNDLPVVDTHSALVSVVISRRPVIKRLCISCNALELKLGPVFSEVCVAQSLAFCMMFCSSLFVLYLMTNVLSVLPFTASDYPFGIFKFLYWCPNASHDYQQYNLYTRRDAIIPIVMFWYQAKMYLYRVSFLSTSNNALIPVIISYYQNSLS